MAKSKKQDDSFIEMTQENFEDIKKELEERKTETREQIAKEIADARELGDLSENHAYTIAMEKKEANENRISDLEEIVKNVKIVAANTSNVVSIGKKVVLLNKENKKERTVTLVGAEITEAANPTEGKVSTDSPIGKAIYNSRVGDTVTVVLPTKSVEFEIKKVA